jgi:hypothetical protein
MWCSHSQYAFVAHSRSTQPRPHSRLSAHHLNSLGDSALGLLLIIAAPLLPPLSARRPLSQYRSRLRVLLVAPDRSIITSARHVLTALFAMARCSQAQHLLAFARSSLLMVSAPFASPFAARCSYPRRHQRLCSPLASLHRYPTSLAARFSYYQRIHSRCGAHICSIIPVSVCCSHPQHPLAPILASPCSQSDLRSRLIAHVTAHQYGSLLNSSRRFRLTPTASFATTLVVCCSHLPHHLYLDSLLTTRTPSLTSLASHLLSPKQQHLRLPSRLHNRITIRDFAHSSQ